MHNLFYQMGMQLALSAQKVTLTDAEALQVKSLQKAWRPGEAVETGPFIQMPPGAYNPGGLDAGCLSGGLGGYRRSTRGDEGRPGSLYSRHGFGKE